MLSKEDSDNPVLSPIFMFPELRTEHKLFLCSQLPIYMDGLRLWNYRVTLDTIYAAYIQRFPSQRHMQADDLRCRNKHITILSRYMYHLGMNGPFQVAGLHDLMKSVDPVYPDDSPSVSDHISSSTISHSSPIRMPMNRPNSINMIPGLDVYSTNPSNPSKYVCFVDSSCDEDLWGNSDESVSGAAIERTSPRGCSGSIAHRPRVQVAAVKDTSISSAAPSTSSSSMPSPPFDPTSPITEDNYHYHYWHRLDESRYRKESEEQLEDDLGPQGDE
ncbi:hypothetical protein C8J56DRAFT_1062719 [Mycena floridula]|nr:hypothetical protein C8J56DRAFT_1062719 [Mycena floridula]